MRGGGERHWRGSGAVGRVGAGFNCCQRCWHVGRCDEGVVGGVGGPAALGGGGLCHDAGGDDGGGAAGGAGALGAGDVAADAGQASGGGGEPRGDVPGDVDGGGFGAERDDPD